MRLPLIAPADLTPEQKPLYDDMRQGIAGHFNAFKVEREGMPAERLATLVADLKPNDLAKDESVAFDVAYALSRGGVLPEPLYALAVKTFGQHGTNELIYLVGLYALVSVTLNGFNVPVPERE